MNKQDLIDFEKMIADRWDKGLIKYPVHLSGGNEDELIEIFKNIHKDDWVFSTHRSHYHYLLKAFHVMTKDYAKNKLYDMIMQGRSMHIMDKQCNFFATGIVAGACAIAVGVAKAIKENNNRYWEYATHERDADERHVWCFVGDGATDEGHFYEAIRYAGNNDLPIMFIVEDNNRSVCSSRVERGNYAHIIGDSRWLKYYYYKSTYPHVGTGKTIKFADMGEVGDTL